jgi:hypothetical protein
MCAKQFPHCQLHTSVTSGARTCSYEFIIDLKAFLLNAHHSVAALYAYYLLYIYYTIRSPTNTTGNFIHFYTTLYLLSTLTIYLEITVIQLAKKCKQNVSSLLTRVRHWAQILFS